MLSDSPALSPPPLESRPPTRPVPAHALPSEVAIPDDGHVSGRQHLDGRTSTSASPIQPQHALNAPHPSLSPLSEYHSGFADEELASPCRSAAPSPSPFSIASHRRQHSFPNLLPLAFRSRTPSPTRKTHTRSPSEQMPFTGDGRGNGRIVAGSPRGGGGGGGGLAGWLSGSAAAANALGLSPGNSSAPPKSPRDTATRSRSNTAVTTTTTTTTTTTITQPATPKSNTSMTTASRFMSALSSRFTNPSTPTSNPSRPTNNNNNADDEEDELGTMDLESALFPRASSSSPSSPRGDAFSPSAYKNLHMNALGLLGRLQRGYREQAAAARALRAERDARRDDLDAAVTRAEHLRRQLEGMARRAQDQEGEMRALAEELAAERRARARAEAAAAAVVSPGVASEGASMVSEDLGVDEDCSRRRRMRKGRVGGEGYRKSWKSGGSGGQGMEDESEEDEDETDEDASVESESVFSRCRSPALASTPLPQRYAASDGTSVTAVDEVATPQAKPSGRGSVVATPKQKGGQPMSAFQKILKGIAGEPADGAGCANCRGQDASAAWDTVGLLRDENRQLKRRVGELEVAVEGALDAVNGVGL